MAKKQVKIYTDGACRGNPGPGGWGAILCYSDVNKEIYGFVKDTTNNKMELSAVIEALKCLKQSCEVTVVTDSNYLKRGMTEWLPKWKRNNWQTSQRKPVKNQSLWRQLDELAHRHTIHWQWIKAHAGHEGNEWADRLANQAIDEMQPNAN
jgi:ribonuclease HI